MLVRVFLSVSVAFLSCALATSSASAAEASAASAAPKRAFVGLSGGIAYASVNHPLVIKDGFGAAMLGMHAGYNVSERWAVGIELHTVEQSMGRDSPKDPFAPISRLQPQAKCANCEDPAVGGWIGKSTAMFGTLGPRVEFAPLGRDGLYFGLSAGVGMILGIDTQYGIGGGARAGYRLRVANVIGLAVEAGVQGQYFNAGTTVFPCASLVMRPYF